MDLLRLGPFGFVRLCGEGKREREREREKKSELDASKIEIETNDEIASERLANSSEYSKSTTHFSPLSVLPP